MRQGDGRGLAAALMLGAEAALIGTRLMASHEPSDRVATAYNCGAPQMPPFAAALARARLNTA